MKLNVFQVIKDLGLPPPKGVLQVGASTGQEMATFLQNGITAGIFIEPLSEPFNVLSKTCMNLPGFVAVNALCSDETGQKVTFHVASNGGQSSELISYLEPLGFTLNNVDFSWHHHADALFVRKSMLNVA